MRRFLSEDQSAVIVSGRIPDKDFARLLPIVNQLDERLNAVRARHPGYAITVTGLSVIAARNSAAMIGKLNRGLTAEFGFVAAFIGLAFRSFAVIPASLLTGVFPVLAAGALLPASGRWTPIFQRGRLDGVVRTGPRRNHTLSEPHVARRSS